ncbi:hypothetical protein ACFWY9_02085 [Amycolatopsis sp. NPDC059027]|uniref:WXG100 family type VII secretion target n=1 Tax=unclassified Amycolatopsis TaxID=2618356 RepID=UPI00366C63D6
MPDGAPGNPPPNPDDPVLKQLNFDQIAQLVNEVSPDVFYQRAEAFDRAAARLQDAVEQIRRQLNIVREAWTGGGADDFDALAKEVTGRVSGVVQVMRSPGYGVVLRAAGDTLAAHQRRMRDLQGQKTEQESKPPAPGAPPPEETARVHNDSARQVLLDLRTAYWDVGNQLPVLSYKDTRIGTDANGNGRGNGNGNGNGQGNHDRPLVTDIGLITPGGVGGGHPHDGRGNPVHVKSSRPERHDNDSVVRPDTPWRTAGPEQQPVDTRPLRGTNPVITQPVPGPWHTFPVGGPVTGRPAPQGPDRERDDEGREFLPPVLGKPERGQKHCPPDKEHRPDKKKRTDRSKVETTEHVTHPVVSKPDFVSPESEPVGTGPETDKPGKVVPTSIDSPKGAPIPVKTVPVEVPKVVTSTGDPVSVTNPPAPVASQPAPVTTQPAPVTAQQAPVGVPLAPVTGQTPPVHTKAVQVTGMDGQVPPPTTQHASFGVGGGGAAAGSASGTFKPEDRGMFTPGSGETGSFQGLDPSAVPPPHAPAPKPGHGPADPMTSQSGGMPMSPMMMGGMAGMGGQGGQQNSRMAAMPAEPRPDAWPLGGGSSGTLGRREPEQNEPRELADGEAQAKLTEKFAELDRLLERGK